MYRDVIEGNWKQIKGALREQWGKLTNDRLDIIAGKREILSGRIRENYGITMEDAERRVDTFGKRFKNYRMSGTV